MEIVVNHGKSLDVLSFLGNFYVWQFFQLHFHVGKDDEPARFDAFRFSSGSESQLSRVDGRWKDLSCKTSVSSIAPDPLR